jgi:hypothetical protein
MDGGGSNDIKVTKDCCHHFHQDRGINNVYFNDIAHECQGRGGIFDNAVDTGRMVECCISRGRGSHAEAPRSPMELIGGGKKGKRRVRSRGIGKS